MCKVYVTNHSELSCLERETIAAKFRNKPNAKHRVTFCRDSRTLVIAARHDTPMRSTEKAIRFMKSLYQPLMIEVVGMKRVAA